MSNYAWMAAACWLFAEGARRTGWLTELIVWVDRGLFVFALIAIVLGFVPTVQQALGAVAKIKIGAK